MKRILNGVVDNFAWVFRILGVDYEQLKAIVSVKLKTDNRRQHISYRKNQKKEPRQTFLITVLLYGFLGLVIASMIMMIQSFMLSMVIFFSYIMLVIGMTLITDFSSILLDTSDNTIILPRPVSGRTLFVARITHIVIYLGQIALGLSIAPAIAISVEYGSLLMIPFFFLVISSILVAVFFTNAIYLLILRFADEENLRNIINYFQIGMAVVMMGGYQILPRVLNKVDYQGINMQTQWWHFLAPPLWMASTMEAFHLARFDLPHIGMAMCAVLIPPAGVFLVNKYLTPIFSRKLGIMAVQPDQKPDKPVGLGVISKISGWITQSKAEKASFELIYKFLARDRKIKLKIYPAFGYTLIFGIVFLMQGKGTFNTVTEPENTRYFVALFYMSFLMMQVAYREIPYSDDFKASWVMFSSPLKNPGEILSGMLKAIIVRLFIPSYIVASLIVLYIWGTSKITDVVFGGINNYLMLMTMVTINAHYLPMSMSPDLKNQTSLIRNLITMSLVGLIGFGHYLLSFKPTWMLALIPVQLVFAFFLHRDYKKLAWSEITL